MPDKTYELSFKMSDGSTKKVRFTAPQGPQGEKGVPQPVNLLDNSDFSKPINQRGETEYSEIVDKYTIDRWKTFGQVTVRNGYISFKNTLSTGANYFRQYFEPGTIKPGTVYTAACKLSDGTICVGSGSCDSGTHAALCTTSDLFLTIELHSDGPDEFRISNRIVGSTLNIVWAALYEGEYTAKTLPKYQPKGYVAEFNECLRYYYKGSVFAYGYVYNATTAYANYVMPVRMRVKPSITMEEGNSITVRDGVGTKVSVSAIGTNVYRNGNIIRFSLDISDLNLTVNSVINASTTNAIEFCADLELPQKEA